MASRLSLNEELEDFEKWLWADEPSDDEPEIIWPPIAETPVRRRLPAPGTRVQRSDRQNRLKAAGLLEAPPPLPGRGGPTPPARCNIVSVEVLPPRKRVRIRPAVVPEHIRPPTAAPPTARIAPPWPPTAAPARPAASAPPPTTVALPASPPRAVVYGPALPPPIRVEYSPGRYAEIPYFSAIVSRQYRLWVGRDKYKLWFNRDGSLKHSRPL